MDRPSVFQESYYKKLKPYPAAGAGERTPLDLWRYAGRGDSSWGSPVLPVSWEQINDVWWNYVKGHNPSDYFGIYDVVRLDTFWLDK